MNKFYYLLLFFLGSVNPALAQSANPSDWRDLAESGRRKPAVCEPFKSYT